MKFVTKAIEMIFGKKSDKDLKEVMPVVNDIKAAYEPLRNLSNDELRNKTNEFRQRIADYLGRIDEEVKSLETLINDNPDMDPNEKEEHYNHIDKLAKERDEKLEEVLIQIMPEAFAVVKETCRRFMENEKVRSTATQLDRDLSVNASHINIEGNDVIYNNSWEAAGSMITWNMVHYDVQLFGGVILHKGRIAEMATGEGKTLVATLPAYLNGLSGQGVHVITVNNYLARRDSEWMGPIFNFLGLTIDCIDNHKPNSAERRKAYMCDIVYGTNNEFGFDYLRDNMVSSPDELVQRKHHYAMIDEVDSVLIDDARTPLIISGPVEKGDEHQFDFLKPRVEKLVKAQTDLARKFLVEAKRLIAEGNTDPEKGGGLPLYRAFKGAPKMKPLIKFLSEPGMKQLQLATESFFLQEQGKRMPEVDEALYYVIEEKNNQIHLTDKGIELITGTGEDPQFFVMPDIGSEMAEIENSGMVKEEKRVAKDELMQDFSVKSERIHSVNQLLKAYAMFEKDVEYVVMDNKVKIVDEQTGRIMEGRRYSDGLHQAIEAKENVKIEDATQTFATITLQNFFKMYHKLAGMTGTAETEAGEFWEIYKLDVTVIPTNRPIQRDDRDDLIFKTEREKYKAVVDDIISLQKAGRPVLVGTTSVEISEKLSKILTRNAIKHNVLNAKQHEREADIVAEAGQPGAVTIATNMAGRGTDIKLGNGVEKAGGLAIIGTERHDARRIDRQLRGRAGRQGDKGSSQFYISLEDKLMRNFGSDRISKVMDRLGHQEGDVIQHKWISGSIETAQKKVEENNFGIRKRLVDYDEVMNKQRSAIYAKRRHAMFGKRLSVDINNTFRDLSEEVVFNYKQYEDDYEGFKAEVIRTFALESEITEDEFISNKAEDLAERLFKEVAAAYKRKGENLISKVLPFFEAKYREKGETIKRISIPYSDGTREMGIVTSLEEGVLTKGKSILKDIEKAVSLAHIDESWKEHLRQMDDLRQNVQTAVYEQKDPLLIFKGEAFNLFRDMLIEMNQELTSFLFRGHIPIREDQEVREARAPKRTDPNKYRESRAASGAEGQEGQAYNTNAPAARPQTYKRSMPKVGNNAPCPCGSGKKYKHCHKKKQQV